MARCLDTRYDERSKNGVCFSDTRNAIYCRHSSASGSRSKKRDVIDERLAGRNLDGLFLIETVVIQTGCTVKFINGSWDGNGAFASGLVLQTTTNGTTWVTSTWTVSPTYSYTNTTAGVSYKFTGAPALVRGVRVVGKLNITGNTSKRARAREVMAYAAQNASLLGANKIQAKPAQQSQTPWQQLIAQLKAQGAPQANRVEVTKYYMFGGGRVAMRQAGNEVFYTFGDQLGSSSLVVDWQGRKISEMRYTPYGETRWSWELDGEGYSNRLYTSQLAQDRNFVGQLHDYGARFLNVTTGRFVSPDTIRMSGKIHLYSTKSRL